MRRSIATVCLSATLEEKLAAAARAGFDGIELFEPDLVGSRLRPAEVRRRAEDLGLRIELYQPLRDFEAVGATQLARNRPRRDGVDPGRQAALPPARRRAAPGDGRSGVEPPLPLLSGPGRLRP